MLALYMTIVVPLLYMTTMLALYMIIVVPNLYMTTILALYMIIMIAGSKATEERAAVRGGPPGFDP